MASSKGQVSGTPPELRKVPRELPKGKDTPFLVWSLRMMDLGHRKWCFKRSTHGTFGDVLKKMGEMEHLSEAELGAQGSHFVPVAHLKKEAQERLSELMLDDLDEVYSLRLGGQPRVISIRREGIMCILWWDPSHEVCPSKKRNT